jgi:hypothetical protein
MLIEWRNQIYLLSIIKSVFSAAVTPLSNEHIQQQLHSSLSLIFLSFFFLEYCFPLRFVHSRGACVREVTHGYDQDVGVRIFYIP